MCSFPSSSDFPQPFFSKPSHLQHRARLLFTLLTADRLQTNQQRDGAQTARGWPDERRSGEDGTGKAHPLTCPSHRQAAGGEGSPFAELEAVEQVRRRCQRRRSPQPHCTCVSSFLSRSLWRTEGLLAVLVPSCWCGNLDSPWGPNAALKTGLQQTCTTRHL